MNRIREIREKQGLSRRALAHVVDRPHSSLRRLERGETDVPAVVKDRIARALDVPLAVLFPHDADGHKLAGLGEVDDEPR